MRILLLCALLACPACNRQPSAPLPDPKSAPAFDHGLSIEEAYGAIPHRRTVVDLGALDLPARDRQYLALIFHVLDQGVALRVVALRDCRRKRFAALAGYFERQAALIGFLSGLEPPAKLVEYQKLIVRALSEQQAFFEAWQRAGAGFDASKLASHPQVRSSSNALHAAYNALMQAYPPSGSNKQAFFDYHCALDFV